MMRIINSGMNNFLIESRVTDKDGIYVSREIAERTVWDKLAKENPTHAVISAVDEEAARKKSEPQIKEIKEYVSQGTVLLDLGCGYGRVAQYLLPTQRISRYIGVDSAYEMLSLFKDRYSKTVAEQSTPLTLVNADIHTLPLNEKSVDLVVVSAVFLHNHKTIVGRAIEELKRVLKPGGKLLIYSSFPRAYTFMGLQGAAYQGFLNVLGKPMKNGPVRYYTKRELKRLFKDFGHVNYVEDGFTFVPKTIIILPGMIERLYRLGIANPINSFLAKILPSKIKKYFAVHLDVIATR